MVCPKCKSENVSVQVVTEAKLKNAHHGILWWVCGGWILSMFKWAFFTLPALVIAIFAPKRQKLVTKTRKVCICQNCGHSWNA